MRDFREQEVRLGGTRRHEGWRLPLKPTRRLEFEGVAREPWNCWLKVRTVEAKENWVAIITIDDDDDALCVCSLTPWRLINSVLLRGRAARDYFYFPFLFLFLFLISFTSVGILHLYYNRCIIFKTLLYKLIETFTVEIIWILKLQPFHPI